MTLPARSAGETAGVSRHNKSNSRVIPAIPKQLVRKSKPLPAAPAQFKESVSTVVKDEQPQANPGAEYATVDAEQKANGVKAGNTASSKTGEPSTSDRIASSSTPELQPERKDTDMQPKGEDARPPNGHAHGKSANGPMLNGSTRELPATNLPGTPSELPPAFFPARPQNGAAIHNDLVNGKPGFVFGGHEDSVVPSPAPASSGSWSSSIPNADSIVSPASTTVNGTERPPSSITPTSSHSFQPNGPPFESSRLHSPPVFIPPPPQQPFQHSTPVHHQRQWTRDRLGQSPRSGSISSIPTDAPYPLGVPPFAPGRQVGMYHSYNNNDSAVSLQRGMPYPGAPPFSPSRAGSFQDMRNGSNGADQDLHSLYALRSYTMSLFNDTARADCALNIEANDGQTVHFAGHSAFLARSPRLRALLAGTLPGSVSGSPEKFQVLIPSDAVFADPNAFHAALRFLYGGPAMRREHLPGNLNSPKHVLEWVLSYAAAGWYLEIPEIATAGISLASELMLVENVDVALSFALSPADDSKLRTNGDHKNHKSAYPSRTARPKYLPYAADLLHATTRFILYAMTTSFDFDRTAPHIPHLRRIPEQISTTATAFASGGGSGFTHASRPSTSNNPRLQGLQLGDFQLHTSANRSLSTVLLSLPFGVLQSLFADRFLLERRSPEDREQLLRALVKEREQRRVDAREVYKRLPPDEQERPELRAARSTLFWEEEVVLSGGEPRLVGRAVEDGAGSAVEAP